MIDYARLKVSAAYQSFVATLNYVSLRSLAEVGEFIKDRRLGDFAAALDSALKGFTKAIVDHAGAVDATAKETSKNRIDAASTTDVATKAFERSRADVASALDSFARVVTFLRNYADNTATTDSLRKNFSKSSSEIVGASDLKIIAQTKALNDSAYATDDINGAAADDNQIMQFLTTKIDIAIASEIIAIASSFIRTYSEQTYSSEVSSKSVTKGRLDQTSTSDSGFLFVQGYSDFSYFNEDYVGITRTF